MKDSGSYRFAQAVRRRSSGEPSPSRSSAADEIRSLAASVVEHYLANIAIAEKLGHSFGFRPLFYWQPVVFNKPVMVPFEREEAQKYAASRGSSAKCTAKSATRPIENRTRRFET